MKNKVIGTCPICKNNLYVSVLKCDNCGSKLEGEFTLSRFDYLTKEQQDFALVFIKNAGNIKSIENELNISYPTVKKNIEELKKSLGMYESDNKSNDILIDEDKDISLREEVKRKLKSGEIDFEEAERVLGESL